MKIGRKRHNDLDVFSGSMNDIMFFLMLFFLIISTLANVQVIKVMLPQSSDSSSYNNKDVSLTITADKQYFINDRPVAYDQIEQELRLATINSADKFVVLRPDAGLTIQDLVDVLEIGGRNDLHMVMASTKSKN